MKVTTIQTALFWEDKDQNLIHFEKLLADAKIDTDLIILPEMFSTGFTMNAKPFAESMNGNTIQWMKNVSVKYNCAITGSIIIEANGKYYNRLIWINGEQIQFYDKRHLFSYAKEDETYTSGNKKLIINFKGWKICPLVCYDLRFPIWSRRTNNEDYDLLIYVANWPERRSLAWNTLLPARAVENQSFVIGVNRIGDDGNKIYHSGDSATYNFLGEKVSTTRSKEISIETIELNLDELIKFRTQFAFAADADDFEIK